MAQTTEGRARVNGVDLHYEIGGEGPPLLLISGLGQNALVWSGVIARFRERFRTIVFDNRGTGRSDVPPGPYTIDAMADDAAGLIRHLGLGPTAVVGWSLGGSVAQSLLIRHGELLHCCVLLNAFPNYTPVQHYWLDALIALRRSAAPPEAKVALSLPWALSPLILSDHARTAAYVQHVLSNPWPTGHEGYEAQAAGLRVYDSTSGLGSVNTPTMVLCGAEDILTPIAQSDQIARLIPGADLRVMGKGGHSMVVDYPEEVLRLVLPWLTARTVAGVPEMAGGK
ncbi:MULTISPECIES: alpha/beta fold hydrolase [unclassified Haematobacter]|uniref:alpha/beta fold hydrolase n=1 Tax=unclassified Haematobacter TaxID=2640585 RepID=UPI0025C5B1FD|nr:MULTISPECIES: alpha/beta hydrolase [unclassified Haematobacter]